MSNQSMLPMIVRLSDILARNPNYQSFCQFVLSQQPDAPHDQAVRFAVTGMARKMLLHHCKKWVKEGSLSENYVPVLHAIADAVVDRDRYYDPRAHPQLSVVPMFLQNLGPRPGVTFGIFKKLITLEQMPFLEGWISKGLVGPFTVEHVNQTDDQFLYTYRGILSDRISGNKNSLRNTDLIACVSYMHTAPRCKCETVHPTKKMAERDVAKLKILIKAYMEAHGATRVFIWQDQACKGTRAESEFDWLSEGLMPYAILPVLKVSGSRGISDVCGRLWLKVELILGMNGAGVWWCNEQHRIDRLYNTTEHLPSPDVAIAAVCRSVLAGYTDDLSSYWREDFLRLQMWSFRILSKDRGAERKREYLRSASIRYTEHIEVCERELTKVMMEVATQPQYNSIAAEARQRARQGTRHSAWSDLLPMIEIDKPKREDRVYYCRRNVRANMLYRYLTVNTNEGKRYIAMPLTETPCGEIVVGEFDEHGRPGGNHKVNINSFSDFLTLISMKMEIARLAGMGEVERRRLCSEMVIEMDNSFLSMLVARGSLAHYDHDSVKRVRWTEVIGEWC